jgi:hypothetical protein
MKRASRKRPGLPVLLGAIVLGLVATAPAQGRTKEKMDHSILMQASLKGDQVTPSIRTDAYGDFRANLSKDHDFMTYSLTYADLEGDVQEAALSLGQPGVNGGVATYLCSNLAHAPDGTPECPGPRSGTTSGKISAGDVRGPEAQGTVYVTLTTTERPEGEIRGQVDVEQ